MPEPILDDSSNFSHGTEGLMPETAQSQRESVFDLSTLAEAAEKDSRGRRRLLYFLAAPAAGIAIVGFLLVFSLVFPIGAAGRGPGVVLAALGLIVLGMASFVGINLGPGPKRLVVTSDYISFELARRRRDVKLLWDSPRFKLTIYDGSRLSKTRRDGHVRETDYVAEISWYPQIPIPQAAYEAILNEAGLHGLSLSRRPMATTEVGKLEAVILQPS